MKTDAELLLNLARPSNFASSPHHSKRVSIDESSHHHHYGYGHESKHHSSGPAPMGREYERSTYNTFGSNHFPPSRTRSQSDGSTVASRPVIRDVRPSTSSSTLAPIPWQDETAEHNWSPFTNTQGHNGVQGVGVHGTDVPSTKAEGAMDLDDGNQASCAACNLVRIPVENGEGDVTWISCDGCKRWFHIVCAGFKNDREIRTVDKFICRGCWPVYGRTTFVRKSSRARTAIDYAGLNQGLVKAASDSLEHHYIEPIRDGRIQFTPESFPRMHPDLVTVEYFERGTGWSEPIVIPAHMNTRESTAAVGPDFDALVGEAPTQEMFDELLEHLPEEGQNYERVIDCSQDLLDMVIPENLTVRSVAELYGPEERVEVIDVKSQQGEDKRWNMQKWADYYESTGSKVVRNVISLEVSQSRLGRLIRRPKIVRDLDLQDAVWPKELQAVGDFPKVQFYCLMSVADCYTDFHIDFGGSSVYYHILKGTKTFFFIPPKDKHLKKYEEWCNSPAQDSTFLGDQTKECYRVDLSEGDTMLIPSGWIHAVWTPKNSLVIGGNFLTKLNYGMQIKITNIEKETKVPRKFRYPFFQKIQWYTAMKYLEEDPIPQSVMDAFAHDETYRFHRDYPVYYEFGERASTAPPGDPYHNSRFYSQAELEGLPDLSKYLIRTALIAGSYSVEGVTMEARNAIRRSIPKGITGDPVDIIKKFGIWVAWKRGNEPAQQWTRPGVVESNPKVNLAEKKPAGRPSRRSERNADNQRMYTERQAVQLPERPPPHSEPSDDLAGSGPAPVLPENDPSVLGNEPSLGATVREETVIPKPRNTPRGSGLGPKRVACDACRKRRIRCNHKDENNETPPTRPMAMNAFGQGMGPQGQPYMVHDAATALSSLAAVASGAGFQDGDNTMGLNRFDTAMYNPAVMTPSATSVNNKLYDGSPEGGNSGKKGRSKACDDCRKSKVRYFLSMCCLYFSIANTISQRRCIHDELGRIDPIKAQERSKPRTTNSTKRPRPHEEDVGLGANKKPKQESTSPLSRPTDLDGQDGEISNAQTVRPSAQTAIAVNIPSRSIESNKPSSVENVGESGKAGPLGQSSYASPPAFQTDSLVPQEVDPVVVSSQPTATLVSPPTSLADETDVPHDHADGEGEHQAAMQTPTSSSRHSSRQPRHVDRYAPEAQTQIQTQTVGKASKPASNPASSASASTSARHASFATSTTVHKTPPGQSKKLSSRPTSSHAKKSASPATAFMFPGQPGKAHNTTGTAKPTQEPEMDEESLRLIRELQEEEFGLRKRTTRA